MKGLPRVLFFASIALVLFDAIAALASESLGFSYGSAVYGSYLIYGLTGFFAARIGGTRAAIIAGVALGLVDATIGWGVSWLIGPGKPAIDTALTIWMWLVVAITVCITATICAVVGAFATRFVGSRPKAA